MPVTEDQVGHSEYTDSKTRNFQKIVEVHTRICKGIISRNRWCDRRYFYLDLTAGIGFIPNTERPNCANVMIRTLRNVGVEFQAHLVDQNNADTLQANLNDRSPAIYYYKKDHNDVLRDIVSQHLPRTSYGLMFYDPNSPGFTNGNWQSLDTVADTYRDYIALNKVDLMMYLSATAIKRAGASTQKRLNDWLSKINKQYWVVGKPRGTWQWAFFLGTNWNAYPEIRSINFYPSNTPEGNNYFEIMNFTSDELKTKNQFAFPFFE